MKIKTLQINSIPTDSDCGVSTPESQEFIQRCHYCKSNRKDIQDVWSSKTNNGGYNSCEVMILEIWKASMWQKYFLQQSTHALWTELKNM
jgi:hypothetical protein